MRRSFAVILLMTFAGLLLHAQMQASAGSLAPGAKASGSQTAPISPFADTESPTPPEVTENWATIELAKSNLPLKSIGGVVLSHTDLPGCTRELVRVQWRASDPIDLYVIKPVLAKKPPVVVFMYNYITDEAIFREDRWCNLVQQNGYAAIGLSSALSWTRMRPPRPLNQWFVSQLQEALAESTHDVQMALNYLDSRGDLDMHDVGMFGQGSGGAVAILAAAADPRLRVLDLMDPWGDWPDWLKASRQIPDEERDTYLKPAFLEAVSGLDPVTYLPKLKGRSIQIQQNLAESVTPTTAKDKIAAAAEDIAVLNRYRDSTEETRALGKDGIVGWLSKQLRSEAANDSSPETLYPLSDPTRQPKVGTLFIEH